MRLSAAVVGLLNQGIASLLAAASDEDDGTLRAKSRAEARPIPP